MMQVKVVVESSSELVIVLIQFLMTVTWKANTHHVNYTHPHTEV
jgi:hypothetical protein